MQNTVVPVLPAPSLGCFYWRKDEVILHYKVEETFKLMSQKTCAESCLKYSYKYFGLANGDLCFCGDEILNKAPLDKKKYCNAQCKNYHFGQKCGGSIAMEIFELLTEEI
ncbi:hypothetical protein BOX15_Mlig001771g3 [Macrostomum lignano]|nr:hypothetical protein BOX15_Mlig001771g3 [Macrostomum lignano]